MINTTLRDKVIELSETYEITKIEEASNYLSIRKEWLAKVDKQGWDKLEDLQELQIDFVIEFQNKLNWEELSYINYEIPEDCVNNLNWLNIFLKYKLHDSFIKANSDYIRRAISDEIDYDKPTGEMHLLDIYLLTEIPEVLMKYQDRIKLMVLDKLNITADSIWK